MLLSPINILCLLQQDTDIKLHALQSFTYISTYSELSCPSPPKKGGGGVGGGSKITLKLVSILTSFSLH